MSACNEGSYTVVYEFQTQWPPSIPSQLIYSEVSGNCMLRLIGHPDGHIEVILFDSLGNVFNSKHFQHLKLPTNSPIFLAVTWKNSDLQLYVEEKQLSELATDSTILEFTSRTQSSASLSTSQIEAIKVCESYINWRMQRFQQTKKNKENRRIKTDNEQMEDLRRALASLQAILERVNQKDLFLIGHLATEIRALIYWQKDFDRNYNPLLLRMASKANLPLPVYGLPTVKLPEDVFMPLFQNTGHAPQLIKRWAKHELMDLQDWMTLTAMRISDGSNPSSVRSITNATFISEAANTLGCAHYDEDTSEFAEMMLRSGTHMSGFHQYLCQIAETIIGLGWWVLLKLQEVGIGSS